MTAIALLCGIASGSLRMAASEAARAANHPGLSPSSAGGTRLAAIEHAREQEANIHADISRITCRTVVLGCSSYRAELPVATKAGRQKSVYFGSKLTVFDSFSQAAATTSTCRRKQRAVVKLSSGTRKRYVPQWAVKKGQRCHTETHRPRCWCYGDANLLARCLVDYRDGAHSIGEQVCAAA